MRLCIAGGVGEHGRNCFLLEGESLRFLVDCGQMAGASVPCPRLSGEQIRAAQYVFLTHSHADHTGALPWLLEQGFAGTVVATPETLSQLPFPLPHACALSDFCPPEGLRLHWGRSGHCPGSVWYTMELEGRTLLFSGDYTEASLLYCTDSIRAVRAELGVIDCAYGRDRRSPEILRFDFLARLSALLSGGKPLLLPVPKYGRGLELLYLLHRARPTLPVYGDAHFRRQLEWLLTDRFWCVPNARDSVCKAVVQPLERTASGGVFFVSDPQLRDPSSRQLAEAILDEKGSVVMTGTPEPGSYSSVLLSEGKMELLRYPVHQNGAQYRSLLQKNRIAKAIAYHSPEVSNPAISGRTVCIP